MSIFGNEIACMRSSFRRNGYAIDASQGSLEPPSTDANELEQETAAKADLTSAAIEAAEAIPKLHDFFHGAVVPRVTALVEEVQEMETQLVEIQQANDSLTGLQQSDATAAHAESVR